MIENKRGVTLTETVLMMPFFLLFTFGLLQLGQIGVGIMVVNYGAGSIARKVAREGTPPASSVAAYNQTFKDLMVAGLAPDPSAALTACCENNSCSNVTNNIIVVAQARISAFPIVGPMLDTLAPNFKSGSSWQPTCTIGPIPTIGFTGPTKYEFIVRGMAIARRNYLQ